MRTPLNLVRPGMTLASPVLDARGRLLLRKGEALSERFLAKLPALGVTHVDVEGPGGGAAAPPRPSDAEVARRVDEGLERRFAHSPPGAWTEALRDAARRALLSRFADLEDLLSGDGATHA